MLSESSSFAIIAHAVACVFVQGRINNRRVKEREMELYREVLPMNESEKESNNGTRACLCTRGERNSFAPRACAPMGFALAPTQPVTHKIYRSFTASCLKHLARIVRKQRDRFGKMRKFSKSRASNVILKFVGFRN